MPAFLGVICAACASSQGARGVSECSRSLAPNGQTHLKKNGQRGFTLIEITVVIMIIALMAMMLIPRIEFGDTQRLRNEAMHLRNTLDWIRDQALYTGRSHRLVVDLSQQSYRVERYAEEGFQPVEQAEIAERNLKEKALRLAWAPELFDSNEELTAIEFTPWGPLRPVALTLGQAGQEPQWLVRFYPAYPRAVLLDAAQPEQVSAR